MSRTADLPAVDPQPRPHQGLRGRFRLDPAGWAVLGEHLDITHLPDVGATVPAQMRTEARARLGHHGLLAGREPDARLRAAITLLAVAPVMVSHMARGPGTASITHWGTDGAAAAAHTLGGCAGSAGSAGSAVHEVRTGTVEELVADVMHTAFGDPRPDPSPAWEDGSASQLPLAALDERGSLHAGAEHDAAVLAQPPVHVLEVATATHTTRASWMTAPDGGPVLVEVLGDAIRASRWIEPLPRAWLLEHLSGALAAALRAPTLASRGRP